MNTVIVLFNSKGPGRKERARSIHCLRNIACCRLHTIISHHISVYIVDILYTGAYVWGGYLLRANVVAISFRDRFPDAGIIANAGGLPQELTLLWLQEMAKKVNRFCEGVNKLFTINILVGSFVIIKKTILKKKFFFQKKLLIFKQENGKHLKPGLSMNG